MTCAEWWRATRARGTSAGAVLVLVLVGLSATSRSALAEPSMPSEPVAFASKSHLLHHASVQLGRSGVEAGYAPGFGKEDLWFGLDTRASVRVDHAGGWFGLRLHSDVVEIRTSALFAYSFRRSFLPLRDSYRRQDAELRLDDEHALYGGISTEMGLACSLFGGDWQSETEAVGIFGTPANRAVYVEHLDVVDHGSYLLRQRLTAMWPWPSLTAVRVGGALEMIALPSRDASVWRAGPVADLKLSPSWTLGFELLPVVASPDTLGLTGSVFDLTLAYRFAGE